MFSTFYHFQQIKSAERYLKRLEFHLAKVGIGGFSSLHEFGEKNKAGSPGLKMGKPF